MKKPVRRSSRGSASRSPRRSVRPPAAHATALDEASAELLAVLESAARLQTVVPDAVLVGEAAAALYAAHRHSFDHDHVVHDLRDRFELVLEALESEGDWVTTGFDPAS